MFGCHTGYRSVGSFLNSVWRKSSEQRLDSAVPTERSEVLWGAMRHRRQTLAASALGTERVSRGSPGTCSAGRREEGGKTHRSDTINAQ